MNYSEWSIELKTVFKNDTRGELSKSLENEVLFDTSYHLFFIQEKIKSLNKNTNSNFELTKEIPSEKNNFKNSEYWNNFDELNYLGEGNFALVFKAKNKQKNTLFAIKKVPLKSNFEIDEFQYNELISNLNNDFIVKYEQFWTEKKTMY
jgi:hypothetical protein